MQIKFDDYFLNREQSEQVVFQKLLAELKTEIPEHLLKFLPSVSFIMLKPDAYLRGLAPSIFEVLRQNNIFPSKYVAKQLLGEDIDKLYMFVKPKYQESWWIMDKIYKLAPSCPALVVGDPNGYEHPGSSDDKGYQHLSSRIRALVGPTTPIQGDESNIRYRFRGGHRIFNLIHGTDDPAAAVREALVFFDYADIRDALEKASRLESQATPSGSLPELDVSALEPPSTTKLNLAGARYRLKEALIRRCESEIAQMKVSLVHNPERTKPIDRLAELTKRLSNLLHHEKLEIDKEHPPEQEVRLLRELHHFQLRTCSLYQDTLREAISEFSRDSALKFGLRHALLANLAVLEKTLQVTRANTTDVEFKESSFDNHLAWLSFLKIPLDQFDEANLHAAWSVLATEFVDFELKAPKEPVDLSKGM